MFSFKVLVFLNFEVNEEGFLHIIVGAAIKAEVKRTWAEELFHIHVSFCDTVEVFEVGLFVKTKVAAGSHSDVKHFSVVLTSCNHISKLDRAPSSFKSLRGMSLEDLFCSYRNCEVKIVFILTDFNRL